MNKKAVSPLIATVLLIAFAVALGAVVMNGGRTYVEDTADKARVTSDTKVTCSMDIRMEYLTLNGVKQICYNESQDMISFTVVNTGTMKIEKLQAKVYGSKSIYVNSSLDNSSISASYPLKTNITYDFDNYGDIQKVSLTPAIKVSGLNDPVLCADNSLDQEDIREC